MVFGILQADTNNTLLIVFLAIGVAFLAGFFLYIRARERAGKERAAVHRTCSATASRISAWSPRTSSGCC